MFVCRSLLAKKHSMQRQRKVLYASKSSESSPNQELTRTEKAADELHALATALDRHRKPLDRHPLFGKSSKIVDGTSFFGAEITAGEDHLFEAMSVGGKTVAVFQDVSTDLNMAAISYLGYPLHAHRSLTNDLCLTTI